MSEIGHNGIGPFNGVPETIQQTTAHGAAAFNAVALERYAQDQKWGNQYHEPCRWVTILAEEVGELAEAALDLKEYNVVTIDAMRKEAVQVAAVAVAFVEWIEKGMPR